MHATSERVKHATLATTNNARQTRSGALSRHDLLRLFHRLRVLCLTYYRFRRTATPVAIEIAPPTAVWRRRSQFWGGFRLSLGGSRPASGKFQLESAGFQPFLRKKGIDRPCYNFPTL